MNQIYSFTKKNYVHGPDNLWKYQQICHKPDIFGDGLLNHDKKHDYLFLPLSYL